jgi:biopolymer transport protein ExbB
LGFLFNAHALRSDADALVQSSLHPKQFAKLVWLFHAQRIRLACARSKAKRSPASALSSASSGSRTPEACATTRRGRIKGAMLTLPVLLSNGGPVLWLLLLVSAVAVAVFIERFLHCHRAQINSTEFLNGVRTVLKRNNVIEALSICDATPGPVARLVKTAILNRDHGRERVREALEEAGLAEVPRLEEKLDLLATIAQLAPLLGLLGTVLGFIQTFGRMQEAGLNAHIGQLSAGVWQALVCAAAGLAVAIPAHAAYNYLVSRVNSIVIEMERAATEIVQIVTEGVKPQPQP